MSWKETLLHKRRIGKKSTFRWNRYLQSGIEKDAKAKLIPRNCLFLEAPKHNAEVQAMTFAREIKRDAFLIDLHNKVGKGITALNATTSIMLEEIKDKTDDTVNSNLSRLLEACKP